MTAARSSPALPRRRPVLASLAVACYLVHAGGQVLGGEPWHALWVCHVACLLIGVGLALPSPTVHACGFLWLCLGLPLWVYQILTAGGFVATSLATHAGGFALGLVGLRQLGLPRGVWWKAGCGAIGLQLLSALLTPFEKNVNLIRPIWTGPEPPIPTELAYFAGLWLCFGVGFAALQGILRWISPESRSEEPA